jgi:hypothetical protein
MISIITEKHAENYFDMRQMTVFVNLFQKLGSGYMKLLPEFQIESAIGKKNEKIK